MKEEEDQENCPGENQRNLKHRTERERKHSLRKGIGEEERKKLAQEKINVRSSLSSLLKSIISSAAYRLPYLPVSAFFQSRFFLSLPQITTLILTKLPLLLCLHYNQGTVFEAVLPCKHCLKWQQRLFSS